MMTFVFNSSPLGDTVIGKSGDERSDEEAGWRSISRLSPHLEMTEELKKDLNNGNKIASTYWASTLIQALS